MASPAEGPNNDETKSDRENITHNARNNGPDASTSSSNTNEPFTSSSPPSDRTRTSTTPQISSPSSTLASPKSSREGSPQRPPLKPGITAGPRPTRSRKNSQDLSPVRAQSISNSTMPTVPSAAAIQRKLSAPTIPHLPPPTTPDPADVPRPQKVNKVSSGSNTPRLRSPPPAASSGSNKTLLSNARKSDQFQQPSTTPSIVLERPSRTSTLTNDSDVGEEERSLKQGMRTPVRGISGSGSALETVQESSLPSTPAIPAGKPTQAKQGGPNDRPDRIEENPMEEALARDTQSLIGSGNESAGHKSGDTKGIDEGKERRKSTTAANSAKPMGVHPKRSYSQLPFTKSKTATEGSVKNMSVETETVSSIPQVALGGGAGERNPLTRTETTGSLRLRPSQETVRPRKEKEKKKAVRKAPSLNAGTGGFLSKRLHHHHIHSRVPSPEPQSPLTSISPDSAHNQALEHEKPQVALLPSNFRETHKPSPYLDSGPPSPQCPPRRRSSASLIPFRGRAASSKADIFEAKVASAVNETNSSDSEETFVYESNPPEPQSARPHRFHSRTPSATSIKSQIRQEPNHSVVGKKSMKFSNNYNSINYANDGGEGTVRGPHQSIRTAGGNTPHHHHIGRYGRGGHASILNDSPFPNATKSVRSGRNDLGQVSPRYGSPRSPHVLNVAKGSRKAEEVMSYDLEGEAADDERAPLIGSIRAGRNRRRPLPGSVRQMYAEDRGHRVCGRVTAFTILGSVLTILVAAIVAICILCAKPLFQVRTKGIEGVTASEAEIIFDLRMQAINPNIVSVQVSDLDINVFAKSKYVGTGEYWRNHPHVIRSDEPANADPTDPSFLISTISDQSQDTAHQSGGVDKGTDPIDDPTTDSQTMLLGRIFQFDSPLIFDPSPFQQKSLDSVGEVKLMKPGNATEEGGSQRWERILLHDFELIVRGVMKYSSPISSKVHSATINGTKLIKPSQDLDEKVPHPGKGVDKGTGDLKTSRINLRRTIPIPLDKRRPQAGAGTGVRQFEFNP